MKRIRTLHLSRLAGILGLFGVLGLAPRAWGFSQVDISTLSNVAFGLALDGTNTYGYANLVGTTNSLLAKIRLSDLVVVSSINLTGIYPSNAALVDSANQFGYFGTILGELSKVDLSNFTEVDTLDLSGTPSCALEDATNGYLYVCANTEIDKIRLSDFTLVSSITIASSMISQGVIDAANGFGYFGEDRSPAVVHKVDLANFVEVDSITLPFNGMGTAIISTSRGFAYFGSYDAPGAISRINLSTFNLSSSLTIDPGLTTSAVGDDTYGYFGNGLIQKIRLSDLTLISSITINSAFGGVGVFFSIPAAAIDSVNNYAYFTTWEGAGGEILKVDLGSGGSGPPTITAQPSGPSIYQGTTGVLTVAADGERPLTYQWYRDGVAIGGATSASYTIPAVTFADDGAAFYCVITNALGSATSETARVTVLPLIKVFPQPWRSDRHAGIPLTLEGLANGTTIKIFTTSMHWVKTLTGSGSVTWDMTNDNGESLASGYYFYVATTPNDRQTVHGKFAIIK